MTRCRALGSIPNSLMAEYYAQRAGAGLIVTEGVSPSPNGIGYSRIPGIFSSEQVEGWKLVTRAVHDAGGKIVVQIMHTGRVSQIANMPAGSVVQGPTAELCPGEMYTDTAGLQPYTQPRAMTERDIDRAVEEFAVAAGRAMEAGFDGIEIHGANGYLIEQFLNANVNRRSDDYGGSIDGRNRFALEVARAAAQAIGPDRVGIRLSPHGVFNSTGSFPEVDEQYVLLTRQLSELGLMYLHLVDHSSMGAPPVPEALKRSLRQAFQGTFILSGGFDRVRAEAALAANEGDLVAWGRAFLANPDLVRRLSIDAPLNDPDTSTFYTPGPKGYTDYPLLA